MPRKVATAAGATSTLPTSVHKTPRFAERGGAGDVQTLYLELRLLADVGLMGLPNAGKSTLLSEATAARAKVAEYAFTTLEPQLGMVEIGYERFVLVDIPGLIEGASDGAGLGDEFLRHLQRTKAVIHLLDGCSEDVAADFPDRGCRGTQLRPRYGGAAAAAGGEQDRLG